MDLVNDYRCQCPAILSGKRCETFIGKCSENPCVNGRCSPVARDNYTCSCFDGFTGQNCTDKTFNFCKPNPCKHGSCKSYDNGPSCTCNFDYEGVMCDRRIDHCRGIDCNQGECKSLEGRFKCKCIEGYTGRFCNETIDHCIPNNCGTGQCINTISDYFCLCKDGKTGKTCQTNILSSNCSSTTCIYGTCQSSNGSNTCSCREGYRGSDCGKKIDYCTENPCSHGSCINQLTGYSCSCDPGYSGTNCSNEKDHCKDAGCVYGLCQNTIKGFTCICGLGYHGNLCQYSETEQSATTPAISQATTFYDIVSNISATKGLISYIQYCSTETCLNGTCIGNIPGHCNCSDGFTGQRCDIFMGCDIFNPCDHGVCTQTNNGYRCTCDSHYTGPECDTELPGKYWRGGLLFISKTNTLNSVVFKRALFFRYFTSVKFCKNKTLAKCQITPPFTV